MPRAPEFSETTKAALAQRVNYNCSRDGCRKPTAGPNQDPNKATITGQAAHIRGAKPISARYDPDMTDAERADISNGIWLCMPCHKKMDTDWRKFSAEEIIRWKKKAELLAESAQDQTAAASGSDETTIFAKLPALWCHETTNDHTYVRRPGKLTQLNAWYNDEKVRTLSIAGIGGAGKTSLVGSWLKEDNENLVRRLEGVFYWSFYVEQDVDLFLTRLLGFLETLWPLEVKLSEDDPLTVFTKLRHPPATLVIMDGLEVLQHALSEGRSYGQFVDAKLRDFILHISHMKEPWLCVTTSRFPLTDLMSVGSARHLNLTQLAPREAEELLYGNGVRGVEKDRLAVAEFLEYHPLTLRVFAASLPPKYLHSPRVHLNAIFPESSVYTAFEKKLGRLLRFYRSAIDSAQLSAIHALSLFRSQVSVATIAELSTVLRSKDGQEDTGPRLSVEATLARLHTSGVLLRDHIGDRTYYACHPIIRDFFRADLFSRDPANSLQAIDLMTNRPDQLGLHGVTNLEPIVLAIESLVELGEITSALELYVRRLDKGKVFLQRGLAKEGKRMFEAFVKYESSTEELSMHERFLREAFSQQDLGSFLIGASEFDIELGEYADARIVLTRAQAVAYGARLSDPLRNLSRVAYNLGNYEDSIDYARRAAAALGATIGYGTGAYKGALALYCLIRALAITGDRREAERLLRDVLTAVDAKLDSVDVSILVSLAGLWIANAKHGHRDCLALATRCDNQIPYMTGDHLAMEARLVAAHGFILAKKPQKAIKHLEHVYQQGIRNSYPAEMCRAMILGEYANYRARSKCNRNRLVDASRMAASGEMAGIRAEALWCAYLTATDAEEAEQYRAEAEQLADLCGYTTLRVRYPRA